MSMQHALDAFLARLEQDHSTSASTLAAYRTDLTQCLAFLADHGIVTVQSLHVSHLQEFCSWLQQRGYATATIARRVVTMRAFSAFLAEENLIAFDPHGDLHVPPVSRTLRAAVTPEQIDALRDVMLRDITVDSWRDRAMLEVVLSTALRASDLVALDMKDVVLETATASVTVRGKKARTLLLTPVAVMALTTYLQLARPKLVRSATSQQALFVNRQGERLTRQGCWGVIKEYGRRLGLDGVTLEALRQSVVVHRFAAGATPDEIQFLLGHAVSRTAAIYQQAASGDR